MTGEQTGEAAGELVGTRGRTLELGVEVEQQPTDDRRIGRDGQADEAARDAHDTHGSRPERRAITTASNRLVAPSFRIASFT